jgi:hypothetical protein
MNYGIITWISICTVASGIGIHVARRNLLPEWTSAPAHLVRYDVISIGPDVRKYSPVIYYTYSVSGKIHSGKDGSLTGTAYATYQEAELAARHAFPSDQFSTYYDKNNPEISDLNPLSRSTAWSYAYTPPLIMIVGIGLYFLGAHTRFTLSGRNKT